MGHVGGEPVGNAEYATAWAAGGLVSTSADIARFWQAWLTGELVSLASRDLQLTRLIPMFERYDTLYGLGVMVVEIGDTWLIGHSGSIHGFKIFSAYFPAEEVIISVMTNDQTFPAEAVAWQMMQALGGPDTDIP